MGKTNISEDLKNFEGKDIAIYKSGIYVSSMPEVLHECAILENANDLLFLGFEENEEVKIPKINIKNIEGNNDTYVEDQTIIHLIGGLNLLIVENM